MPAGNSTSKFTLLVERFKEDPHVAEVFDEGHLDTPLDPGCLRMLEAVGCEPDEIAHINSRPNALKERVRRAIVDGLNGKVMFSVRPTGAAEESVMVQKGPIGTNIVLEVPYREVVRS